MSVIIEGMEMPKEGSWVTLRVFPDGQCFLYSWCEYDFDFMEHLTAIPVPDHGRLIDADAFAAEMKKRQDACAEWRDDIKNGGGYGTELYYRADSFLGAMCETKLTLDKMPTIIPADRGDENG